MAWWSSTQSYKTHNPAGFSVLPGRRLLSPGIPGKKNKQLDSLLVGLNEPSFSDLVILDDESMSLSPVSTLRAAKRRRRTALEALSLVQMLAPSQTGNQGRDQRRFVLFPRQALGGTVGRELEQAARAARQWHRIHGSCFLQCFMPTATAALQMRVNIAGGAVHPGSSPVAWSECQTPPSRVTSAQRTHCVIPPRPPHPLSPLLPSPPC